MSVCSRGMPSDHGHPAASMGQLLAVRSCMLLTELTTFQTPRTIERTG